MWLTTQSAYIKVDALKRQCKNARLALPFIHAKER